LAIQILPVGRIEPEIIDDLRGDLEREFGFKAAAGKAVKEPVFAYDAQRGQYNSTAILYSIADRPDIFDYERVVGVAGVDLFASGLNFVFGEAGSKAAVISLFRLNESFYGRAEDRAILRRRVLTEAAHELGHTFGLGHCTDPGCVMFFSNTIHDTDMKGPYFRGECLRRLLDFGVIIDQLGGFK